MLEFYRDRFVQLLHDAPAKEPVLSEPKYSPYLQSVMDTAKKEGVLNLAMINWSAFEMEEVTPADLNAPIDSIQIRRCDLLHIKG